MTTVRKFLFENDFDVDPEVEAKVAARAAQRQARAAAEVAAVDAPVETPAPPPEPTFSQRDLDAASAAGREQGLKEGEATARAAAKKEVEQRIATALGTIGQQIIQLQTDVAMDRSAILGDAATLAMAMLRRMLPEFSRRGALAEVEAVIERCLIDQRREPRLVVRAAPDLVPLLEARIAGLTAEKGFEGRVALVADDRLSETDCSVEWADGGMQRHADKIWQDIAAALDRCLTLQGVATPSLEITAPDPAATSGTDGPADQSISRQVDDGAAAQDYSSNPGATSDADASRSE
ncbi:MAG: hypothetical protein JNL25_05725 [Rhodospirillaceae bacterium]|nr:hypothetical protein [Rhodospirillaceae bacterium]